MSAFSKLAKYQTMESLTKMPELPKKIGEAAHSANLHEMYMAYRRDVFAYALHFSRSEDDALDALQETFFRALRNLRKHNQQIESPRAWLIQIARNVLLEDLNKTKLEGNSWAQLRLSSPDAIHSSAQVLNGILLENINGYVKRDTTALEYEVFVLRHFHELNLAEIATVVDQPLTNVHRILTGLTGKIRRLYGSSTE